MKVLIRKFQAEWPAWTAIAFFALLPFNRSEIPLLVFAIAMPFLWRSTVHGERTRRVFFMLLPLFLCFWIPMVLSSFDSSIPVRAGLRPWPICGCSWRQPPSACCYTNAPCAIWC